MLGRKDAHSFFAELRPLSPKVFTTAFDSPTATPAEVLADAARSAGLDAQVVDGAADGVRCAVAGLGPQPHVVLCGSLHFVGEILAMSPETWPD